MVTDAHDPDRAVAVRVGDKTAYLGGTDVQRRYQTCS
jgi:hypothetical protein